MNRFEFVKLTSYKFKSIVFNNKILLLPYQLYSNKIIFTYEKIVHHIVLQYIHACCCWYFFMHFFSTVINIRFTSEFRVFNNAQFIFVVVYHTFFLFLKCREFLLRNPFLKIKKLHSSPYASLQ